MRSDRNSIFDKIFYVVEYYVGFICCKAIKFIIVIEYWRIEKKPLTSEEKEIIHIFFKNLFRIVE